MTADQWGIVEGYEDALGVWRKTPPDTREAILAAMGPDAQAGGSSAETPSVQVVSHGRATRIPGPAEVSLEDGATVRVDHTLPPDFPMGYHDLQPLEGGPLVRLIVAPSRCYIPGGLPTWGWAVQLYAMRSRGSWGMGDLADLRHLARWSAVDLGAGMLMLSPLHAVSPTLPQEPSPYSPSSRRYRNPLYLRVEEVPGAAESALDLEHLAAAGRDLNSSRHIDRDAVFRLKMEALETLWAGYAGSAEFDRYLWQQGDDLYQFAVFCALAEHYGGDWREWPEEYRHPQSPAVARFAANHGYRVRFHQWLQWLLEGQLEHAADEITLVQDLPIGFYPGGADAWMWQDMVAPGVTVGTPPDKFNTQGQDWGVTPLVPHRLRAAGYDPFIQTVRATMPRHGGLRIDHVMGLFRLFWIPQGMGPAQGTFVRYPANELLAILAVESHRARALVVGEDLGTVEEAALRRLARRWVLSYRLMWFESRPARRYPRMALAAVTTHDLPTITGLWRGTDLQAQRDLGLEPNEEGTEAIRRRLAARTGLSGDAPPQEVVRRTHRLLAEAPSLLVTATLDDALAVEERPNIPGTTAVQRPNWSLALPATLEELRGNPLARAIANALGSRKH